MTFAEIYVNSISLKIKILLKLQEITYFIFLNLLS